MDLAPGTVVGEYRVEHKLGEGGMASVYAAIHPLIGKRAAIKVMSPRLSADAAAVARFALEARAVNRIGHPNIVDVFSFGQLPDGRSYFVMEWLQGETLYERMLKQHGPLPLDDVVHILDQICDALEAAHEAGIVHRDLKPANVFLCPVRGRRDAVKLLDFGVAKLVCQEPTPGWTSAGMVVGTPEYVSPEQARGRDVDARSDLYSLGVMAYEMVLGRPPFLSDNPADAIEMHLGATPPRPSILWPAIPPPLETLLRRLLAKRPEERATLAEIRATLAAIRPTATPALDRVDAAPSPRRVRRRRQAARLALVVASFVGLAIAGYWPARLHARRLQAATPAQAAEPPVASNPRLRPAASLAARAAREPTPADPTAETPAVAAPAATGHHPRHRIHRDRNYLLDPFKH